VTGTILNALGILIGCGLGLTLRRQPRPQVQFAIKGLLGVFTVIVGLRAVWAGLGGGFWLVIKQVLVILLALAVGRVVGRVLRIQRGLNKLGQYAKERLGATQPAAAGRVSEGFLVSAVLFCAAPLALLGPLQDGLDGRWQALGIKAMIDAMAAMAFVTTFGWSVVLAIVPLVAVQGTITLLVRAAAPFLQAHGLQDPILAISGLLVFCVALIILEIKRFEIATYFPALAFGPVFTWLLA
jgi:hypothetical protein